MKAFGFLLLLLVVGASEGRLTWGGQLRQILEGKEEDSPEQRHLENNKNKEETGASDVEVDFPYCHPTGNKYKLKKNGNGHAMHYETGQGVKDFKPGETIPMGEGYMGEGKTLADDCSFVAEEEEEDEEEEEEEEPVGGDQEYCVAKGQNAKNGYHVKKFSGKPNVETFPMETCTNKTPVCLKKEKNGQDVYVIQSLNYTPKKAVDMSFCEQDSDEDDSDEDEDSEDEDSEDEDSEDEDSEDEDSEDEDSEDDDSPYCIDNGDGTYNLEYSKDPPAGALEPGDTVGDKVLSDFCELEGGGEVTGDPHFVMWSGQKFDFHGGCDMVLVQNPDFNNGQGLYVHIRTKIQRWWSYVDSAVVQIGEDTLEVMGGVAAKRFFVNGERGTPLHVNGMMPFTIGGHAVRYRNLGPNMFQFKIFLPNNQTVVLKAVKDFMRVDIEQPSLEDFASSVGLMGSFETGQMVGRDGATIFTDENEFGLEWQVIQDEPMLFHNVEGVQHPETCAMPTLPQDSRRLEEGTISREEAEVACSKVSTNDFEDCVSDVMATNDPDMVGAF